MKTKSAKDWLSERPLAEANQERWVQCIIDASTTELNSALETLRLLHDYQNGCPLEKYKPYWDKAMADAESILERHGK